MRRERLLGASHRQRLERPLAAAPGSRPRRRPRPSRSSGRDARRSRSTRYWTASIVCPCLPISSPSSRRCSDAVTASSSSTMSIRQRTPSAAVMCSTQRRARWAASSLSPSAAARRPLHRVGVDRRAITRAGAYPTPSSPRSPSETTWKLHRRLVEPGMEPLQLAQRRPLRLADGLAGRLDRRRSSVIRAPFFFRFTRAAAAGGRLLGRRRSRGFRAVGSAASALRRRPRRAFRRRRTGFFGTSRRVTSPWPTVHRFVVTQ